MLHNKSLPQAFADKESSSKSINTNSSKEEDFEPVNVTVKTAEQIAREEFEKDLHNVPFIFSKRKPLSKDDLVESLVKLMMARKE